MVSNAALRSKSTRHPTCPSFAASSRSFVKRNIAVSVLWAGLFKTETCHEGCRSSHDPIVGMTLPSQVFWQEKEG